MLTPSVIISHSLHTYEVPDSSQTLMIFQSMKNSSSLQAVVMAAGKGSRMTDVTCGKAKCLLPVGGRPLLWYPLNMLRSVGFTEVIVIVPDSVKAEVAKFPEKFDLSLKLDVVAIPAQDAEQGTADSLRFVHEKLTGGEVMVVSGDVILEDADSLRSLVNLHRRKSAAMTCLLARPSLDLKTVSVPGAKTTKYKRERDLIGLKEDHLVFFTAEADVEDEEVRVSSKVLQRVGNFTINSNLVDAHIYIFKKWICDYIASDPNISTIKGELLPILVRRQFSKAKSRAEEEEEKCSLADFAPAEAELPALLSAPHTRLYSCYAFTSSAPCYRVNTMPAYWHCSKEFTRDTRKEHSAVVGEKAALTRCSVSRDCHIADRTTLTGVYLGQGTRVQEKVRITNSVIMDNVLVETGSVLEVSRKISLIFKL